MKNCADRLRSLKSSRIKALCLFVGLLALVSIYYVHGGGTVACLKRDDTSQRDLVSTYSYSYYLETADGTRIVEPGYIKHEITLLPEQTAIVIMDPWKETSFPQLNVKMHKMIVDTIVPLMDAFIQNKGCKIYVFTNSPQSSDKTTIAIDDDLMRYVENGYAEIVYHQNYTSSKAFIDELRKEGISNLIYFGSAINMCIPFRIVGIVPMHLEARDLHLFVCPEATLAVVNDNDKDNEDTKKAMCIMLAQNKMARVIYEKDLLAYWRR